MKITCERGICAKSRVAPLKKITLPKLELCGALVLAQLFQRVQSALTLKIDDCYFWTDSTITLSWLSSAPNKWKTFTANRVSQIQQITKKYHWRHVPTLDNPADLVSRGIKPTQLQACDLWWHGPTWLSQSSNEWPILNNVNINEQELPERRKILTAVITFTPKLQLFDKYSSFTKLQRITAYCLRFINNSKCAKEIRLTGCVSVEELKSALNCLIKLVQQQEFQQEICDLRRRGQLSSKSKLLMLNPFIDNEGLLRVGGRLKHAEISYNQRYPIILPASHSFTSLLVHHEHIKNLHAGPQLLIAIIRLKFWPLRIRNAVKKVVRNCITCFKANPTSSQHLMGNLPKHRLTLSRPFDICGIDYAGPILIKDGGKRAKKITKAYLAIFVCFATKAVHIELVSNLTSDNFLSALKRFIARRGKCSHIYSDNATNFVGAKNELEHFLRNTQHEIQNNLLDDNISWHFIPPRSPHFGGIWEAAVKSAKRHLNKIIGDAKLTFEELYTLTTQIEACLNSRPLTPFSEDPNDLSVLTPGHFLIGDALSALPECNVTAQPINRLSRWQRVCQLKQHFWSRWKNEYLATLQNRCKWKTNNSRPIQVNDLVLIRDEHSPPYTWPMGRIHLLHPGDDGLIRVVTVRTVKGLVKRAVAKLCVLPLDSNL